MGIIYLSDHSFKFEKTANHQCNEPFVESRTKINSILAQAKSKTKAG